MLAGYAFARLEFRGRQAVFLLMLSALMLPSLVTGCALTVAALLGLPAVLPLGAARPRLRGRRL